MLFWANVQRTLGSLREVLCYQSIPPVRRFYSRCGKKRCPGIFPRYARSGSATDVKDHYLSKGESK
jgi:hypothetical protein